VLVGRLFSTLRLPEDMVATGGSALDPLLLGETGPGVPYIMYLSYALITLIVVQAVRLILKKENPSMVSSHDISLNDWAITFLRVYVGLIFIAHYSGHVLAGPEQFQVFASYFAGVGFHIGGPMVVLEGVIEIAVSIGLVFGLATRFAATSAVFVFRYALGRTLFSWLYLGFTQWRLGVFSTMDDRYFSIYHNGWKQNINR
jgi:putative oxidoreductase